MPRTYITFEDLYQEVAEIARENKINNQEEWNELVDEVMEGYVDMGELDPDQDIEGYKSSLAPLWTRFKKEEVEEEINTKEDINSEKLSNQEDEFGVVEDFAEVIKKEEEGF